jgi:RNA polymerase sigma-70 factor (ECF subfamily)
MNPHPHFDATTERDPSQPDVLRALVAQHRRFLDFVERRVGSRAAAEDIVQDAFVRGIDRLGGLRDDESAVAWFYRVLRNALTDHYRRTDARSRAMDRMALDSAWEPEDPELHDVVCGCLGALVDTLTPSYADAIRRVELGGESLEDLARDEGITRNNAAVRVHRARAALRRQLERSCGTCATHGCLDCSCDTGAEPCAVG